MGEDLVVLTNYTHEPQHWLVWPRSDEAKQVIVTRRYSEVRKGTRYDILECSKCAHANCKHVRATRRHREVMQQT